MILTRSRSSSTFGDRGRVSADSVAFLFEILVVPFVFVNRGMHVVMRQKQKEWPRRIAAPDKRYRFVRESFSDVFAFVMFLQIRILPGRKVSRRWLSPVPPAKIKIKSLIRREITSTSQVPFAREERLIPRGAQDLCQRNFLEGQFIAIFDLQKSMRRVWFRGLAGDPIGYIHTDRMPSRHDTGASG